jgi:anti-sigma B factor antagonist
MEGNLRTEEVCPDGQVVLAVRGDIDMATAAQFEAACARLAATTDRLILDFSGVEFMDSSGLKVLVTAHHDAKTSGVAIRNASDRIMRVLEISGLAPLFIEPTQASAPSTVAC